MKPRAPHKRKWLRRGLGAIVVLVAARIALTLALPGLIELGARSAGLTSTYGSARISLLRGVFVVDHLVLRPRGAESAALPPALVLDHARLDVAMLALLTGDLRVQRFEIDGAEVHIERDAAGRIDWAMRVASEDSAQAVEPIVAADANAPLDLGLPFDITALRIHATTLHFVDRAVMPAFEARVSLDLRVSDAGSETTPATWRLDASAPGLLEHMRFEGLGAAAGSDANGRCDFELAHLALEPLRAELATFGLAPDGELLSAHATLGVRAHAAADDARACAVELNLVDVGAEVDREIRASLAHVSLGVATLGPDAIRGVRIDVGDGALDVARRANGEIALLGLRVVDGAKPMTAASASSAPAPESAPMRVDLAAAAISDLTLHWRDETTSPHATLDARLAHFAASAWDPSRIDAPSHVSFEVAAPGVLGTVRGEFDVSGGTPELRVAGSVDGDHASFAGLAPYLATAGLAPDFEGGRWSAKTDARLEFARDGELVVHATLGPLDMRTSGELVAVDRVKLDHVALSAGKLDATRIEIDGVRMNARRTKDGSVHCAGVRTADVSTVPNEPVAGAPAASAAGTTPHASDAWTRFDFADVAVSGIQLRFVDDAREGVVFDTRGSTLEVENLGFGGVRGRDPQQYGRFRGRFVVSPVLAELTVEGETIGKPGPLDLDTKVTIRGSGLDARPLAPYLALLGIEPELSEGAFRVQLDTHLVAAGASTSAQVKVRDLELVDGKTSLVQLDRAGGTVRTEASRVLPGQFDLALGRIDVTREADGSVRALGMRWRLETWHAEHGEDSSVLDVLLGVSTPIGARLDALFDWPTLDLGDSHASAVLGWHDRSVSPAVDWTLRAKADLRHASIGPGARTSAVACELEVQGVVKSVKLSAEGEFDPHALHVKGDIELSGVDGAALEPYLPPTQRCELASGAASASFELAVAHPSAPEWSFSGALREVRAGEDGAEPLVALAEASVSAPSIRLDAEHGDVVAIDRVAVRGLRARVKRTDDGAWHTFGLVSGAPRRAQPDVMAVVGTATDEPAALQPAWTPPLATKPAQTPPIAPPRSTWRVRELELELAELRVDDARRGANAVPLVLSGKLANSEPLTLAAPQAAEMPPLEVRLTGALAPIGTLSGRLRASPHADPITFDVEGELADVRGAALVELFPELARTVDVAASMKNGVARVKLAGQLRTTKRSAGPAALANGFSAQLAVNTCELLDAPNGRRLAGLDSIVVDVERVDPRTGDVRVKSIEITRPFARFERGADGFHAFGLVFAPQGVPAPATVVEANAAAPAPASDASERAAAPSGTQVAPVDQTAPVAAAAPASVLPAKRAPVVSIERVLVSGVDVEMRDATSVPQSTLTLTGLDAELHRFTTRALTEPVPISFSAYVTAGDLELPRRTESASLLAGVAKATGHLVVGASDEKRLERRALFDEIAINGRITLAPLPGGWITIDVGKLELAPFSHLAEGTGVTLGDGVLDQSVRIRLQGANGVSVQSTSTFSHLRVAEAPDGPISRYLALPMPLDAVLYVLEDAEGRQRVPVSVHIAGATPSRGELMSAVVSATASVIAQAIASSPLRVVGGIGGLFGLGGEAEDLSAAAEHITFGAGDTELPPEAEAALARAATEVSADTGKVLVVQQVLGSGDVARAAELANPSSEDVRALVERLRQRRAEIVRAYDSAAAEARVSYSVGRTDAARAAVVELRALDAELGDLEDALDNAGDLLRPSADKKRDARTRGAALRIATERMENVRRRLVELGVPAKRVELRRARYEIAGEQGSLVLVPKRRG